MGNNDNTEKPSRRERQRIRHRAEIMDAAETIFSEKGYHLSTMEEIARRADFSVGSLYNFFKNKEELYAEIFREKAEFIDTNLRRVLADGTNPFDQIRKYFSERLDLFWNYPRFFRLLFNETRGTFTNPGVGFPADAAQRYNDFLPVLEQVFENGIERGVLRPVGAKIMMIALEGIIRTYTEHLIEFEKLERDLEEEVRLFQLFSQGVIL